MSELAGYLILGTSLGLVYGLLALGLVLVYKGTRILNLAHPYFGLLAAFVCWWLTDEARFLPFQGGTRPRFIVAAVLALVIVGLQGWLLSRDIFRKLREAPRLVTLVLTIALAQGLTGLVIILFERNQEQAEQFRRLPALFTSRWEVGNFVVSGGHLQVFLVVPVLAVALAAFFRYTRFGVAVRAAAENADAARLLGISVDRVRAFTWITAPVLAGIAGILITTQRGNLDVSTLSIGFLVRALAAALIGGLTSLPGAVIGGLAVGIGETLLQKYVPGQGGLPETALFAAVVGMLLFRPGGIFGQREETEDKVALVPTMRDLPARLRQSPFAPLVSDLTAINLVGFVLAISMVAGSEVNGVLVTTTVFAMVGVSLTVLMGYSGQISLGHWALVGVGAFAAANLFGRLHVPFLLTVPLVVVIGMGVSLLIGLPALRIKGLYLAIVTLAFSYAAEFYIFKSQVVASGQTGLLMPSPKLGPLDLDDPSNRPLLWFAMAMLAASIWVARNLARSRTGRAFFALRENEKAAATLGVSLTRARLWAFVVSGGIASLAGAVMAMRLGVVNAASFATPVSLTLVAMVMIGGIGSLHGAVLGALLVMGMPDLVHLDNEWIVPIGTGILLLVVIVRARGGLAGLANLIKVRIVGALVDIEEAGADDGDSTHPDATPDGAPDEVVDLVGLEAEPERTPALTGGR